MLLNNDLVGKKVAVLGLAFKANREDVRYSLAITFIERALEAGAFVKAYDPIAMHSMKLVFPNIDYGKSLYDTVNVLMQW